MSDTASLPSTASSSFILSVIADPHHTTNYHNSHRRSRPRSKSRGSSNNPLARSRTTKTRPSGIGTLRGSNTSTLDRPPDRPTHHPLTNHPPSNAVMMAHRITKYRTTFSPDPQAHQTKPRHANHANHQVLQLEQRRRGRGGEGRGGRQAREADHKYDGARQGH